MDTRNTLFQVCDLEVGTERGGGNHRFLGCCKLHPIHQGPSFVGRPKKSYFYFFIYFYFYFLLCWVFVSVRGLSLVAASGGHSSSRCAGLSLSRPLLLRSTGSRHAGSVVVAQGPSCSAACRIFPDQGSNPCPLHRQADSQPLRHQGSSVGRYLITVSISLLVIGLFIFSISSWFSLEGCAFLRICPFLPGCPFYWHRVACSNLS